MLSRDSLRYLRALNPKPVSRYVCPLCATRPIPRPLTGRRPSSISATLSSRRCYRTSIATRQQEQQHATPPSPPPPPPPLDSLPVPANKTLFGPDGDVRSYFKQWSTDLNNQLDQEGAVKSLPSRSINVGNSLYVRDVAALNTTALDAVHETSDESVDSEDTFPFRVLHPGDVFTITLKLVPEQFALYIGRVGHQSQYILADGRWLMDVNDVSASEVASNFVSSEELAALREILPQSPVTLHGDPMDINNLLPALGHLPSTVCTKFSRKFRQLGEEQEAFLRDYSRQYEDMYDKLAVESAFKHVTMPAICRDYFGVEHTDLTKGASIALNNLLHHDPRYVPKLYGTRHTIVVLPKRMVKATRQVSEWSRAYQDSAARASAGLEVTHELKSNPLTAFISKARRLVSKSRKVRLPTEFDHLGLTLPDAVPDSGKVERRPTGETFTEDDKKVIMVIWNTFIRKPHSAGFSLRQSQSVCALILRAVGAYPNKQLDAQQARLFLQELGCLDPWYDPMTHNTIAALPYLGLNHNMKVVEENLKKAMKALTLPDDPLDVPFTDTMAEIRRDWGDLEAFAVDGYHTVVVDDAFSVEPSKEYPGHHWLHVHIAHPAAFIPSGHEILQRAAYMVESHYGAVGSYPMLPSELSKRLGISDQRPSPVLTTSTLLAPDGSVKDVQVSAGIIRNVVKIEMSLFDEYTRTTDPKKMHYLVVGERFKDNASEPPVPDTYMLASQQALQKHKPAFDTISQLMSARQDARHREHPDYYRPRVQPTNDGRFHAERVRERDLSFDRLFRSEHCHGDPFISIIKPTFTAEDATLYDAQRFGVVGSVMNLASESTALWCRNNDVSVIYRNVQFKENFSLEKLNNVAKHESYVLPMSGSSLVPSYVPSGPMAQAMQATNPLRKHRDLVNQYQISAYLKAQAAMDDTAQSSTMDVVYPFSREQLVEHMNEGINVNTYKTKNSTKAHWTYMAIFRALHCQEALLPEVFDVFVGSRYNFASPANEQNVRILPWFQLAEFEKTEEGFETRAKPNQFVPCKIRAVYPFQRKLIVYAVGPPTDDPTCQYPELEQDMQFT